MPPARRTTAKPLLTVVPFEKGEKVRIGQRSFSNVTVTDKTTVGNLSTLGYSVFGPGRTRNRRSTSTRRNSRTSSPAPASSQRATS